MENPKKCAIALSIILELSTLGLAQIHIVNITPGGPFGQSGETCQNSEPTLAIKRANPQVMVASAFVPDPNVTTPHKAPIYVSYDGGETWGLVSILPGNSDCCGTGDITVRFGGTSNELYIAYLYGGSSLSGYQMQILNTSNLSSTSSPNQLVLREGVDQPYAQATSYIGVGARSMIPEDRVYVGNNNFFHVEMGTTHNIATVDHSQDATSGGSSFSNDAIERNNDATLRYQDEAAVRTAIHPSGVVYAVYYKITSGRSSVDGESVVNVIVVRDDNWCATTPAFGNLKEINPMTQASTGIIGQPVVTGVQLPHSYSDDGNTTFSRNFLGSNRLTGANLSIAVDPGNSNVVYVAWADDTNGIYTLHVRKSVDGGQNWTDTGLSSVPSATNPALAVNIDGKVGFLYQEMDVVFGETFWATHLRRSSDGGASWSDDVLSRFSESKTPYDPTVDPYLGDYLDLQAMGKDFYGVFSASNFPDRANFPVLANSQNSLSYQRNADFTNNALTDIDGTVVKSSIDPFFFHVTELGPKEDFYVRDFTNADGVDDGSEPSIDPRFCVTSDVWNLRSATGANLNDNDPPPVPGDDPQQVPGHNFAYVRIHRKAPDLAERVHAHFLYSEYGLGNNYMDAASTDITFPAATGTTGGVSITLTSGIQWDLPADNSPHNCLAVEISSDNDPLIQPSLLGRVPGWDNGTDLMVFNDNNKAQRNMGLYTTSGTPTGTPMGPTPTGTGAMSMVATTAIVYALIHNPTLEITDMELKPVINPIATVKPSFSTVENKEKFSIHSDKTIVLNAMKPGESRFLKVSYLVPNRKEGKSFSVTVNQVRNGVVVNAFSVLNKYVSLDKNIEENFSMDAVTFGRAKTLYQLDTALLTGNIDREKKGTKLSPKDYRNYLIKNLPFMKSVTKQLIKIGGSDAFDLSSTLDILQQTIKGNNPRKIANAHLSFLNSINACLTSLQLEKGNSADILQTIRLQRDILQKTRFLSDSAKHLVDLSDEFISGFEEGKLSNTDYPAAVTKMLTDLKNLTNSIAGTSKNGGQLISLMKGVEQNINNPTSLQGAHIKFLLLLREMTQQKGVQK